MPNPTDPAQRNETRTGSPTARALMWDAKQLEALGQCGCFDYEDEHGAVSYECRNHPIPETEAGR